MADGRVPKTILAQSVGSGSVESPVSFKTAASESIATTTGSSSAAGSNASGRSGKHASFAPEPTKPQSTPSGERQNLLSSALVASPLAYGSMAPRRVETTETLDSSLGSLESAPPDAMDPGPLVAEPANAAASRASNYLRRNTMYDPQRTAFFNEDGEERVPSQDSTAETRTDSLDTPSRWWDFTGRIATPTMGPEDPDDVPKSLSQIWIEHKSESASMFTSIMTLTKTLIGAGWLSLPYLVSQYGLVASYVLIVSWAVMTTFTCRLLCSSARYLPPGVIPSWASVCDITYPWLVDVVDAVVLLSCFGTAASFFVGIGDFGPSFAEGLDLVADPTYSFLLSRWFWATVTLVVIGPVCWAKNFRAFRFTSFIGQAATLYMLIFVFVFYFVRLPPESRIPLRELRWWPPKLSISLLSALPILSFIYACHQNIYSMFNELRNRTPQRVDKVIYVSVAAATVFYLAAATMAYMTFGDRTHGDVLVNYPPKDPLTISACLTLTLLVGTSIPMQIHPARISTMNLVRRLAVRFRKWRSGAEGYEEVEDAAPDGDDREDIADTVRREPYAEERAISEAVSEPILFNVTTAVLLALCWVVAVWVTHLDRILSFVGATGNTALGNIIPYVFFVSLSLRWTTLAKVCAVLGVLGFLISGAALAALAIDQKLNP